MEGRATSHCRIRRRRRAPRIAWFRWCQPSGRVASDPRLPGGRVPVCLGVACTFRVASRGGGISSKSMLELHEGRDVHAASRAGRADLPVQSCICSLGGRVRRHCNPIPRWSQRQFPGHTGSPEHAARCIPSRAEGRLLHGSPQSASKICSSHVRIGTGGQGDCSPQGARGASVCGTSCTDR